jgi:hypothetical protein
VFAIDPPILIATSTMTTSVRALQFVARNFNQRLLLTINNDP